MTDGCPLVFNGGLTTLRGRATTHSCGVNIDGADHTMIHVVRENIVLVTFLFL